MSQLIAGWAAAAGRVAFSAAVVLSLLAAASSQSPPPWAAFVTVAPGVQRVSAYGYNCLYTSGFNPCDFASTHSFAFGGGGGVDVALHHDFGIEVALDGLKASGSPGQGIASVAALAGSSRSDHPSPYALLGYGRGFSSAASRNVVVIGAGLQAWRTVRFGWRIGVRAFLQPGYHLQESGISVPRPGRQTVELQLTLRVR